MALRNDKTIIEIYKSTKEKLFNLKNMGESYDDVINRLIENDS